MTTKYNKSYGGYDDSYNLRKDFEEYYNEHKNR